MSAPRSAWIEPAASAGYLLAGGILVATAHLAGYKLAAALALCLGVGAFAVWVHRERVRRRHPRPGADPRRWMDTPGVLNLPGLTGSLRPRDVIYLVVTALALVATASWLFQTLRTCLYRDAEFYRAPWLLGASLDSPRRIGLFIVLLAVPFLARKRLSWKRLPAGRTARIAVLAAVAPLAWYYSTYSYNLFLDQSHVADRLMLAGLAVAAWFTCAVVPLFLFQLAVIEGQFYLLVTNATSKSGTDYIFPVMVVALAAVMALFNAVRRQRCTPLLVAILAVGAAYYCVPAMAKFRVDWHSHERLGNLICCCWANGWRPVSADVATWAADVADTLGGLLIVATLATELGALALATMRVFAIPLLTGMIALHIGIYATSGIFFWKWIVLDAGLILALVRMNPRHRRECFGQWATVVVIVVVAVAPRVFNPPQLGWLDTPATQMVELEVQGESGRWYAVPRHQLAPYDKTVTQNRMLYLTDEPVLVGTYGATMDHGVLERVEQSVTRGRLTELIQTEGRSRPDAARAAAYVDFVRKFYRAANRYGGRPWGLPFAAPIHIWTTSAAGSYAFQEPVQAARLRYVVMARTASGIETVDDRIVREFRIAHRE